MGGHGGLNILPQKKWNVYNWDNRQIVERDKQLDKEKKRKQFQQKRSEQLENKMKVLQQQSGLTVYQQQKKISKHSLVNAEMKRIDEQHKHVNLFEEEQRILLNKQAKDAKRLKEEEFLKDKNMDFSSRFLGAYNDQKQIPWYSKKKGFQPEKHKNRHFIDLDDVIYGLKTDSKITRQVIEAEKKQAFRAREEDQRDRTRQKLFRRYQQYEDKYTKIQLGKSQAKQLVKNEQDLLLNQFKNDKEDQIERLRQKRLRREQKERKRAEQLKKRLLS